MSAAERQRRRRARVRRGEEVLRVTVKPEKIIPVLLRCSTLTEADADDWAKIEEALSRLVADLSPEMMVKI